MTAATQAVTPVPISAAGIDGRLIPAGEGRVTGKGLSEMMDKMVNASGISIN